LVVDADRDLLASAVGNLLQNAFKFTRPHTEVKLSAYANGDRILIDVKDNCGGLPPGDAEKMFEPFTQRNEDKIGVGLGLSIAKRGVEANGGILSVRDVPGIGCIFTIDLPRHAIPLRTGSRAFGAPVSPQGRPCRLRGHPNERSFAAGLTAISGKFPHPRAIPQRKP
jgi:K+-sensing histidine kinase KdpD